MAHSMEIPRSICREDALAPNNTKAMRLVLIVAIFIFHAGIHMGFLTPDLGHVCVSVFFFLSGYGLEYSLANKPDYVSGFLHKRVLGLMIQYWIIMTVLAVFVFTIHRSWDQFLRSSQRHSAFLFGISPNSSHSTSCSISRCSSATAGKHCC